MTFTNWNGTTNINYQITGNTLTLSNTPTIMTRSDGQISSTIAGTGFVKDGAGILRIDGNSGAYVGNVTVNAGILQIGNNGSGGQLGTGNFTNNATVTFRRAATFTITNGGIYGSMLSTPILNTPQSGILGLHKIQKKPVVGPGDTVVVRPMMYLALSYDHRLIDGAIAALERCAGDAAVGCIVLTGAGRGFCAGGDVTAMGGGATSDLTLEQQVDRQREGEGNRLAGYQRGQQEVLAPASHLEAHRAARPRASMSAPARRGSCRWS